MSGVSKHSEHYAAGSGMRRARSAAWIVTLVMGGTTMTFQVYHAVKFGHMPWELAVLYGIVPLLIALLVLEIVAEWREAPWPAKAAAYAIMAAAMFLSASATGAVVLHAAPGHFSLLPGALLDAAELLAAFFIMNGPTAAQAIARVAARERELLDQVAAGRSALERAEAEFRAGRDDLKARAGTEIGRRDEALKIAGAARDEAEQEAAALRAGAGESAGLRDALERVRADLASERAAREDDQAEAARALERAVKAARAEARKPRARTAESRTRPPASAQDDMANELRALMEFADDPTLLGTRQGGRLADKLGVHPSTGRRLHVRMVKDGRLKPEYAAMAAPLAGDAENREQ